MLDIQEKLRWIWKGLCPYAGVRVAKKLAGEAVPAYPYLSYSVGAAAGKLRGTPCRDAAGAWRSESVLLSLSVHAESEEEALAAALAAQGWFLEAGGGHLADGGMAVEEVSALQNRDVMRGVVAERRQGFDVRLAVVRALPPAKAEAGSGEIREVVLCGL